MPEPKRSVVAIVDDDEAARQSLQFPIEVIGHEVAVFASAAEFLKAELAHVVCAFVDHHMPGMSGLQLVEQLRAAGEAIPVALVTGAPSSAIAARATALGLGPVLAKPLDEAKVVAFVEAATR